MHQRTTVLFLALLWLAPMSSPLSAAVCDVDGNGVVDLRDIRTIFESIGQTATGPDDPRDGNDDGVITVNDARYCVARCTLPRCAEPPANAPPVARAGDDQTVAVLQNVTLDGSGSTDDDGDSLTFSWSFVVTPAGSMAALSDPTAVMPTFFVDMPGSYTVRLVVNDGTVDSAPDTVTVTTVNSAPVADAGRDQTVLVTDTVTLDGSGSRDIDGDVLTFFWSFVSRPLGSGATLSDPTAVKPSFVVDLPGSYVVELVVNDGAVDSAPDGVIVTTENSAPEADAGPDQSAFVTDTVTLDGSGSSDVDGDSLIFFWSFVSRPVGSGATLSDPTAVIPSFVVDVPGMFVIQLIVNDGTVNSAPDTVTVTTENSRPVADAGADQSVFVNDTVFLDGTGSSDDDGDPLTFQWSLTAVPAGSTATLSDATSATPSFVVDLPGTYVVQLVVDDGTVNSAPDTVSVTTENSAPVADAGADQLALVNDTVTLDGSASFDADLDPLTYSWSFVSRPAGSTAALSDPTDVLPSFLVDLPGTYVVQLVVNDGTVDSAPDTVTVTTENSPPAADAGPDQSVLVTDTVTLDGSGSSDADGDILTFSWSFLSTPPGSTATLSDPASVSPTFVADLPGAYQVELVVNDGNVDSAPDTVTILASFGNTLTLAPEVLNLLTLDSGSLTLSLSSPAGPGGLLVSLVSSDPAVASVPADVVVPEGLLTADVPVTTGTTEGSVVVTASAVAVEGDSSTVNVGPRTLTLTSESPLVGVGRTIQAQVSIIPAAPAGGVTVTLASDDPAIATIDPPTVTIAEGETTAPATITGVAVGSTQFTADAPGFAPATEDITVTDQLISIDNLLVVAPGQTLSLAVSLTSPAPPGGTTIRFTSADTGIATITPTAFVPAGAFLPQTNPQVTGVTVGVVNVTASALGFAPDTRPVTVSLGLLFVPPSLTFPPGPTSITLVLSAPAPAGGLLVDLSTDDPAVATVPPTVTIPAGQTSTPVPITGVSSGSTILRANASGVVEARATLTVAATITLPNIEVGDDLQRSAGGTLGAPAPPTGVTVTITSSDPSRLLLSRSATMPGSTSIDLLVTGGNQALPSFFVHGLDESGIVPITASAPGYANGSANVTLAPSGFRYISSPSSNFTTNTFAANTTLTIGSAVLHPNLSFRELQAVRVGLTVMVDVTSSDTNVGTITVSPVSIAGGSSSALTHFDPRNAGSTVLTIVAPPGFQTPANNAQLTATVDAPEVRLSGFNTGTLFVGDDLQRSVQVTLEATPPGPVDVTVTVGSGSIATLSLDPLAEGGTTVTFFGVTTATAGTFYLQGRSVGSTTNMHAQATGFADANVNATVTPSGFRYTGAFASNFTTTAFSANTSLQISATRLNPTSLVWAELQNVRGGLTVSVSVTSSDANVGSVVGVPVTFGPNENFKNFQFDPANAGATVLAIEAPAGFETPSTFASLTVTVTAPAIRLSGLTSGNFDVGLDLQQSIQVTLAAPPPAAVAVTITSGSGAVAKLSANGTLEGGASLVFPGVTGTLAGDLFLQAMGPGTTTLTAQAPGYQTGTFNVTVVPSGFRFVGNPATNFSTTTFSSNTLLSVSSVRLNPSTLDWAALQPVRGGKTASVGVTSGTPTVGAITISPIEFTGGQQNRTTAFDPLTAGTTLISIVQPAGFTTPATFNQMTATVSAPNINVGSGPVTVGKDLQLSLTISLEAAPPQPVDVTVTSNSGAIALISRVAAAAGGTSITFTGVTTTTVGTIFVQGIAQGSTQLSAQASGYDDGAASVVVGPSGFRWVGFPVTGFTTTVGAANTTTSVSPVLLNPATLNWVNVQAVRGGHSVMVDLTSSNPAVGIVVTSPITFGGGVSQVSTQFDPLSTGTTLLSVVTPAGFFPVTTFGVLPVTVNP